MPSDYWSYTARPPRHPADDAGSLRVRVAQASRRVVDAELRDLSRQGCQLCVPRPLLVGKPALVRIEQPGTDFRLTIETTIRWQRPDQGTWLAGCQAAEGIGWESLGELFLSGVLRNA